MPIIAATGEPMGKHQRVESPLDTGVTALYESIIPVYQIVGIASNSNLLRKDSD